MMALDPFDNLDTYPLKNFDSFIEKCKAQNVKEVNLTGSNTDPLLYKHQIKLIGDLRAEIPGVRVGLRTNGALILKEPSNWFLYDKASISVTTLNPELYIKTMGQGNPPNLERILNLRPGMPVKANVVICPEVLEGPNPDLLNTIRELRHLGFKKINIREPYGQPHIGDPLAKLGFIKTGTVLGMPLYGIGDTDVVYWDVHYVEVESVNLYANGVISETYPVTKGHDPVAGKVEDQTHFQKSGRVTDQWLSRQKKISLHVIQQS